MHGAYHRQVLEGHLRGAVLADRDTGMRSDQIDISARYGSHSNLIECAREERGEGGGERYLLKRLQAYRRADKLLLRDIDLDKPIGIGLLEFVREGGVAHLAVQGNH